MGINSHVTKSDVPMALEPGKFVAATNAIGMADFETLDFNQGKTLSRGANGKMDAWPLNE